MPLGTQCDDLFIQFDRDATAHGDDHGLAAHRRAALNVGAKPVW